MFTPKYIGQAYFNSIEPAVFLVPSDCTGVRHEFSVIGDVGPGKQEKTSLSMAQSRGNVAQTLPDAIFTEIRGCFKIDCPATQEERHKSDN